MLIYNKTEKRADSYEFKTHNSVRKWIFAETDLKNISEFIDWKHDITINEIIKKLNLKAVNETVRKTVIKTRYIQEKIFARLWTWMSPM